MPWEGYTIPFLKSCPGLLPGWPTFLNWHGIREALFVSGCHFHPIKQGAPWGQWLCPLSSVSPLCLAAKSAQRGLTEEAFRKKVFRPRRPFAYSGDGGLVAQSCLTLCDPMDRSPPGSSVGFSRQEYWRGLSFPPLGDLPDTGIESESPELQADSLPLSHWGSLQYKLSKPRWHCC